MDGADIYAPPSASLEGGGGSGSGAITASMIDSVRKTRPWVIFIAVLASLVTALVALGALAAGAVGTMDDELDRSFAVGIGVGYMVVALLYGLVAWLIWRLGLAMGKFLRQAETPTLEGLLRAQMRFWRTIGLMAASVVVLYALILVVGLIFIAVAA